MQFGYARVSTKDEQTTALQLKALKEAGVEKVFEEEASGGRWERPELHRMLDQLREGDVVFVWKLDRLSRSLKDLLHILDKIRARGAGFRSLTESIDTTTAAGRMMMQMLGAFAEFEREMIRERTRAGLQAAREQGRIGGRPPKLTPEQRNAAIEMVQSGQKSAAQVARIFGVHRSTISRLLAVQLVTNRTPPEEEEKSQKNGAPPEEEKRLFKKFRQVSPWFIFYEYNGSFPPPRRWTLEEGTKITRLRECHRSLGVVEGTILSFDSERGKGRFQIGERQYPFCFHREEQIPGDLNELIGQVQRYTFRPLIKGVPDEKREPTQGLTELRLKALRLSPKPETNYVEIMGLIYRLHPDGFWVITWDFHKQSICHVPFSTSYPYPDERGAFAWLKGKFEPKTGQISLLEAEAIDFLEGDELEKAKKLGQKRRDQDRQKKELQQEDAPSQT